MAMSLKNNILPPPPPITTTTDNQLLENTTTNTATALGHRRQLNHGLEINTSKTNAFFHTADIPTPRPPPSLSRKISIKQTSNLSLSPPSPPPPPFNIPSSNNDNTHTGENTAAEDTEEDNEIYHHDSYANRLRNLVASTRHHHHQQQQASPATVTTAAPSPIPHYLNATLSKKSSSASIHTIDSPLTASPRSSFEDHPIVDEIEALPTPHPGSSTSTSSLDLLSQTRQQHHFVFPPPSSSTKKTENTIIPVLSTDILRPSLSNEIPKLSDNLNLGDDNQVTLMKREKSRQTDQEEEEIEDLVGKQVGNYCISNLLGVGAFSHVYLANHVDTNELFAIKSIQKGKLLDDPRVRSSIEREVGVLKFIDHPNIVHLEATMETENSMCIVLEYVQGGELFDFVQKMHTSCLENNCQVDEVAVKQVFLQLLHAVKWLHEHNIVHRDLKLENILVHKTKDNQHVLKITDFGLARVVDPEFPLLTTRCGSEEYAAPEIIQSKQEGYDGRKTDTWSLGVILYALLVGYLPFRYDPRKHERVSQLFYRIVRAQVKWPTDIHISQEAKDVVKAILERKPEKRIPIDQIEDLPWFHI